jgi:hypothetical protein
MVLVSLTAKPDNARKKRQSGRGARRGDFFVATAGALAHDWKDRLAQHRILGKAESAADSRRCLNPRDA